MPSKQLQAVVFLFDCLISWLPLKDKTLLETCIIEATKMHGFATDTLSAPENVPTQPEIIVESPKIIMELLSKRIVSDPPFR